MSGRLAILCPGQGGQHPAMLEGLSGDERGQTLLQQYGLEQRLDCPLEVVLGDHRLLFANRYAQPLVVAAGLIAWQVLRADVPAPAVVAGYSVGELTAYGVAGALSPEDAIELAVQRARCMDACLVQAPQQGLMAVSGIVAAKVEPLLREHDVFVAIDTGADTLIAGGLSEDLKAVQSRLSVIGAKTGMLPVGIASHTPLMHGALASFSAALGAVRWSTLTVPVVAGVSGQTVDASDAARDALTQQLTHTIRWTACMDQCAESDVGVALELGPGMALSRMLRARHPHIECRSVSEFRSLSRVVGWLEQHAG